MLKIKPNNGPELCFQQPSHYGWINFIDVIGVTFQNELPTAQ